MQERISILIVFCGFLSILLQIVGIASPAWMCYSFGKSHVDDWTNVPQRTYLNSTDVGIGSGENRTTFDSHHFNTTTDPTPSDVVRKVTSTNNYGAATKVKESLSFSPGLNEDEIDNQTTTSSGNIETTVSTVIQPGVNYTSNNSTTDSLKQGFVSVINGTYLDINVGNNSVSFMTRLEVQVGLWSRSACLYWSDSLLAEAVVEDCKTEPTLKLEKILSTLAFSTNTTALEQLVGDFNGVRCLSVGALVLAIGGFVLLLSLSKWHKKKTAWPWSALSICWLMTVILSLAGAIKTILDTHSYADITHDISYMGEEYTVRFWAPWSTIVSTFGGVFALFVASKLMHQQWKTCNISKNTYTPLVNNITFKENKCSMSQNQMETIL